MHVPTMNIKNVNFILRDNSQVDSSSSSDEESGFEVKEKD